MKGSCCMATLVILSGVAMNVVSFRHGLLFIWFCFVFSVSVNYDSGVADEEWGLGGNCQQRDTSNGPYMILNSFWSYSRLNRLNRASCCLKGKLLGFFELSISLNADDDLFLFCLNLIYLLPMKMCFWLIRNCIYSLHFE